MFHSRNDLLQQIFRAKPQARGIDSGMAADIRSSEHVLVDKELYPVFLVIHKSQHAHGARRDIQKLFHLSIFCERESCRADL